MQPFTITPAENPDDIQTITRLFEAYALSLGIDLGFQDFVAELASLPGKYGSPTGRLLLARQNDTAEAIGCVALRPLPDAGADCCEMKRLYVDPRGRGTGVGRALAERVIVEARHIGYKAMRLDTLPQMESARALYARLGFTEIEAYYATPLEGTLFMELDLR